ncbi:hypothetical protein [Chryseosolibacter indicus]|uniref:Uncharacterized protein n=1 Tax=Chryseosolibacter indicus TaxID=2782351 RepID=A0ABS5VNY7_9BACT|nr:hypothetical protein [Chryseosolibacter indicus]MBT1703170.1 hypothetical protein [Chryseosolibacter indicus]
MATIRINPLLKGMKGSIGGIMVRQVGKRTILSGKPSAPRKQSVLQKSNRDKFREATRFAKHILQDPQKKSYYQQRAKKLKLPNAYTAAITDYMRKTEIKAVETQAFQNKRGAIKINVHKSDFAVNKVRLILYNASDAMVETNLAEKVSNNLFLYRASQQLLADDIVRIRVIVEDHSLISGVRKDILLRQ